MEREIRGPHAPPSVLVVVDQPVLAEVIRLALGHAHLQTRVAPSERAAVTALGAAPPHLAVVDADIGDGGLLENLRAVTPGADPLPVLALTRRGDLETKLAAFAR